MAEIITVARPYAEAVFRLAKDANRLAPWGEALAVLAAMMEHSEVVTLVTNPKSTAQEVGKLIVDVLGDRADVEVKNFIDALQENHRLTLHNSRWHVKIQVLFKNYLSLMTVSAMDFGTSA